MPYYSREIVIPCEFLNCPENRYPFLVDEIFRGTNTLERVAASAATLRYLTRMSMAWATTHGMGIHGMFNQNNRAKARESLNRIGSLVYTLARSV